MVDNLIILPGAERDAIEACAWYEGRETGLGEQFLSCLDDCLLLIRRNPDMYEVVYKTYRRAIMRRFPYAIFFRQANDTTTVYSIFHCSQHPRKWRKRLP